jgi:hypothetical protein
MTIYPVVGDDTVTVELVTAVGWIAFCSLCEDYEAHATNPADAKTAARSHSGTNKHRLALVDANLGHLKTSREDLVQLVENTMRMHAWDFKSRRKMAEAIVDDILRTGVFIRES